MRLTASIVAALILIVMYSCAGEPPRGDSIPKGDTARISSRVKTKLLKDRIVDGEKIEVKVEGDIVILEGQSRRQSERLRAQELALSIEGVNGVVNRLTVMSE